MLPATQHWRLQFSRPLVRRESIVLQATLEPRRLLDPKILPVLLPAPLLRPPPTQMTLAAVPGGPDMSPKHWDIPLLTIPDADRSDAEIILQPVGVDLTQVNARGLEIVAVPGAAKRDLPGDVWRVFRVDPSFQGDLPHLQV